MNGWMNGQMDGWMDGLMDGWMDGHMDGWIDGWMYEEQLKQIQRHTLLQLIHVAQLIKILHLQWTVDLVHQY